MWPLLCSTSFICGVVKCQTHWPVDSTSSTLILVTMTSIATNRSQSPQGNKNNMSTLEQHVSTIGLHTNWLIKGG